jgi:hypothetical protein
MRQGEKTRKKKRKKKNKKKTKKNKKKQKKTPVYILTDVTQCLTTK